MLILSALLLTSLASEPADAAPTRPPLANRTYSTEISPADGARADVDEYAGQLLAGEILTIRATARDDDEVPAQLRPRIELIGPDGVAVAVRAKSRKSGTEVILPRFRIPATGVWTVRVSGEDGTSGAYVASFGVRATRADERQVAVLGAETGRSKQHVVQGVDGAVLRVELKQKADAPAVRISAIRGPHGEAIALPARAVTTPILTTFDLQLDAGAGRYSVEVKQRISSAATAPSRYVLRTRLSSPRRDAERVPKVLAATEPRLRLAAPPVEGFSGQRVMIEGSGFSPGGKVEVEIGSLPAVVYGSGETWVECDAPVSDYTGRVEVSVINEDGQFDSADGYFSYLPLPAAPVVPPVAPPVPAAPPAPPADPLNGAVPNAPPAAEIASIATLSAGTGFTAATTQPSTVGTGAGSTCKVIARWNVVPWQTVRDVLDIGIVAFHINGISRVDFSLDGGPWASATKMTRNASSGTWEYTVRFDPSSLADGEHQIRAIAYPTVGVPRLFAGATETVSDPSMFLYTNVNNTLPEPKVWVDSVNGNDGSGTGTSSSPYRTIRHAAGAFNNTTYSHAGGGTIYLKAGSYGLVQQWPFAWSHSRWLTITPAPGVSKSACPIDATGNGLDTQKLRLLNLLVRTPGRVVTGNNGFNYLWADNTDFDGTDRLARVNLVDGFSGVWYTNCTRSDTYRGFESAVLVRDCVCTSIGEQGFSDSLLVVNSSLDDLSREDSDELHPDVYFHRGAMSEDNVILYGVRMTRAHSSTGAQGFFAKNHAMIRNVAYVNVQMQAGNSDWNVDATDHMLIWNSTIVGSGMWIWGSISPLTLSNISVRSSVFSAMGAPSNYVTLSNAWFQDNHYVSTSPMTPGSSGSYTTGNAGFVNESQSDFRPTTTSTLRGRQTAPLTPVDAAGVPRGANPTVGAFE